MTRYMVFDCLQCSFPSDRFVEGVCEDCYEANQRALDQHNFEYDQWSKLSDQERDSRINFAVRSYE